MKRSRLIGFRVADRHLRLLFRFLPTGIGIVFLQTFGQNTRLLAEILLIDHSVLAHDECHHARRPVLCRIGQESKTPGHFAVYDVILFAAWTTFPLALKNEVVVTAIRSRGAVRTFGVAPCEP